MIDAENPQIDQSFVPPPPPEDGQAWPRPSRTAYPMKPTDSIGDDGLLYSGALGAVKAVQHERRVIVEWTGDEWRRVRPRLSPLPVSNRPSAADLFEPEPDTWGLRGDPYLWDDMQRHLASHEFPTDERKARRILEGLFQQLVGCDLADPDSEEMVFVERYAHGGMSSGQVDLPTWRKVLIPLLLSRVQPA